MEFRLFILSLACLCCLTPPAFGSIHLLKAAAVVGAAKGAALLGAGALAVKGAAIKGAFKGAVKGAAVKGAAILAAKGAAVKGALALAAKAAKFAAHKLPAVLPPPILVQEAPIRFPVQTVVEADSVAMESIPSLPPVLSSLSSLWGSAQSAVQHRFHAVGSAIESLHQRPVIAAPIVSAPAIYEIPEPDRFYPLLQKVEAGCL